MRISDRLRYETLKKDLLEIKSRLDKAQSMISSGSSIISPKDDPVKFSISIQFESELRKLEQYSRNVQRLLLFGGYYDSCLSKIEELIRRAKEIAVSLASDTMDAQSRRSSSEEIKGIIEQMISIGNTNVAGIYIFGGKKTNIKPFEADADYNVRYMGTKDVISVEIDNDETENLGISGFKVFFEGTDLFSVLKGLKDALERNDAYGIKKSLENLDMAHEKVRTEISYVGSYVANLERKKEILELRVSEIEKMKSELKDADLARIISDFNALTLTYQTMLYAMAKIQDLNILNYIR